MLGRERPPFSGVPHLLDPRIQKVRDGESGGVHAVSPHEIPFLFRLSGSSADHSSCSFLKYASMAGAWNTRSRAGISPSLPKEWACPQHTLMKSPGPAATAAFSSSTVTVPSRMKNASEAVRVPVRGWPAPAGAKGAIHERETALGLFCYRLEIPGLALRQRGQDSDDGIAGPVDRRGRPRLPKTR